MKIRTMLVVLITAALTVLGGAAYANSTDPRNGGVDTRWHNHGLYDGGNPTKVKDGACHARIAGPYPSGTTVIARYRVECTDSSYLMHTDYVARLKNLNANYGASLQTSQSRCLGAPSTKRIDGAGVAWWGCTYTLKVTDKAPAKAQTWQANLYNEDTVLGPDGGSTTFVSVITYCANHRTWCNDHPAIPAMQYWVG